jgi:hypothetical protein
LEEHELIDPTEIDCNKAFGDLAKKRGKNPIWDMGTLDIGKKVYRVSLVEEKTRSLEIEPELLLEITNRVNAMQQTCEQALIHAQEDAERRIADALAHNLSPYPITADDFNKGWSSFVYGRDVFLAKYFTWAPHYYISGGETNTINQKAIAKAITKNVLMAYSRNSGELYPFDGTVGNRFIMPHTTSGGPLCKGSMRTVNNLPLDKAKALVLKAIELVDIVNRDSIADRTPVRGVDFCSRDFIEVYCTKDKGMEIIEDIEIQEGMVI